MARLELAVLGGFHAALDGTTISSFDSDKTRALLVYVAVEVAYAQRRDVLAGLLWPELSDEAARRNLRYALFKLRQALGEPETGRGFLIVTPQTVGLDPAADIRLDVAAFAGHLTACQVHRHRHVEHCATCHAHLEQAAALYRGEFLHGVYLAGCQAFEEWLLLRREGLHRSALDALGWLASYHEARAEYPPALEYSYRQLALEPWREEATRQAMRLLAARGDRSAALAQYAACRQVLAAELNAEPSAATTALYEQLIAQPSGAAPLTSPGRPPAPNLPRELTPFVGREAELRLLIERLDSPDTCLLTLIGPGGVGKTRLAQRVAWEQVGAFADGVYWIPLASVSSPALLASSIAQAIGLYFEGAEDPQAQLLNALREKEMLLVFDNFEQLLSPVPGLALGRTDGTDPDATELLLSILESAPRISILVTSRERLGLHAEFLLDLSGLPLPAGEDGRAGDPGPDSAASVLPPANLTHLMTSSAVQLFVERAQHAHAPFALSADTAHDVVEICRLVRGLPLGIVLAAAWVRHFPPARIVRSIRDNLDFLSSAARDTTPQHRSLRAVFNHSWNLLSDEEQRVFRQLAVFRGGWEEEAAERVVGASIYSLASLVDKSLLRHEATGRFEIHEVLRQYATEKLGERPEEQDAVRHRHAATYLALAQAAKAELQGTAQVRWLARLEQEHANLRAVLEWAVETGAAEIGVALGGALWRFWYIRGYNSEGRAHLAAVLALPASTPPTAQGELGERPPEGTDPGRTVEMMRARTGALNGAGVLATVQGDQGKARLLYEESLALSRELGDTQGIAASLNNLGVMAHQLGDAAAGRALHEQSLALRRELGDKQGVAASLNNLGLIAQEQGDYALAQVRQEEALILRRELGDTLGIASSLGNLGVIAQEQGNYEAARVLFEESLTLRRELGDKTGMAELFSNLGVVARKQGDYAGAHDLYEQCLTLSRESGYTWSIAIALSNLGMLAQDKGDYAEARALHEEALGLRREVEDKQGIAASLNSLGIVAYQLGDGATAQALSEESLRLRRELGDKWGIAASLNSLGLLARQRGEDAAARTRYAESLALRRELGDRRGIAASLAGLGALAAERAQRELAPGMREDAEQEGPAEGVARLFGAVDGLLESMGSVLDREDRQAYERQVAQVRTLLGAEAFARAWAAGRALSLEQALREALPE
jgi:predicted ATPase/DNA-binding SARP family transcriptional activator/Tfp pilus assembly protein PilF